MGSPKSRGKAAARVLGAFFEEMKAAGFIADTLRWHGIEGASVAQAAGIRRTAYRPFGQLYAQLNALAGSL